MARKSVRGVIAHAMTGEIVDSVVHLHGDVEFGGL
jgi:hypothetical protein